MPDDSRGYGDGVTPDVVPYETSDGSMTLYDKERGIYYRSRWGAARESRHTFIEGSGLTEREGVWRVLELGFGAAMNLVQTVRAFRQSPQASRLLYHTVDWRPVGPELLGFHEGEGGELARAVAAAAAGRLGEAARVSSDDGRIDVVLYAMPWEAVELEDGEQVDAVFHDPFAKDVNPEAWTAACFAWSRALAAPDARLTTYSAATPVRRAMLEAGWVVARTRGAGRKREMTIASPTAASLAGLEIWEPPHA